MLTKESLISAIHDTLAKRWVKNDFGLLLMLGASDFNATLDRPEVQAFVDGIASRLGIEDAEIDPAA